jgi:hypothetical protein
MMVVLPPKNIPTPDSHLAHLSRREGFFLSNLEVPDLG